MKNHPSEFDGLRQTPAAGLAPASPKFNDPDVDLTKICWTQWLRAHGPEVGAAAPAQLPPVEDFVPEDLFK